MLGLRCEWKMRVVKEGGDYFFIKLNGRGANSFFLLPGVFGLYDQSAPLTLSSSGWDHIVLEVVFGQSYSLTINGGEPAKGLDAGGPGFDVTGASVWFGTGLSGGGPTGVVAFDDVRCDPR
jgi:hypothetical protein